MWEAAGTEHEPTADPALPPIPAYAFDQRIAWQQLSRLTRARRRAGSCLPQPACPHAATLAPAPTRKRHDQRAEQTVAAANRRLTRPTGSSTLSLVRLK
jgi:hypothetical protein